MNPYPSATAPDRWLPPALVEAIRATTTRWGSASAVLGLMLINAMPVFGYLLPTSYDVTTVFTVGLGTLASACLLMSGIGLLIARSYVATGYLRYRKEYLALGVQLGTVIPGWLVTIVFILWYSAVVVTSGSYKGQEQLHFTASIVLYMLLPVVAMLVNSVNLIIVFSLFFPSPRKLNKYATSG